MSGKFQKYDKRQLQKPSSTFNEGFTLYCERKLFLKGGTAINLFYNNAPRLSIDIVLTYLGFEKRDEAYKNINQALLNITSRLNAANYKAFLQGEHEKKIICSNENATIKIEPNYIIRGYIEEPEIISVCDEIENEFGYVEIKTISKMELYGGKICAALDRQHPRDLFDIKNILPRVDGEILKGFIAMLLCHNKPIHELLLPNIKNGEEIFEKQFTGMTNENFTYQDHIATLNELIENIKTKIAPYKNLLLAFVSLNCSLNDFEIQNIEKLPAIAWKISNLKNLKENNPAKFSEQYEKLSNYFTLKFLK